MRLSRAGWVLLGAGLTAMLTLAGTGIAAATSHGNPQPPVSVPGGIASDSVGLAMVQTNAGVEVQSVVPSVTAGTITIRLNKAPTKAVMVGWSVVS